MKNALSELVLHSTKIDINSLVLIFNTFFRHYLERLCALANAVEDDSDENYALSKNETIID